MLDILDKRSAVALASLLVPARGGTHGAPSRSRLDTDNLRNARQS